MPKVFISIGSNIGDRQQHIDIAIAQLAQNNIKLCKQSKVYETKAWGVKDQPNFLNVVIEAQTDLDALALLALLKKIESKMGRHQDAPRWSSRIIDLDILFYDDKIINTESLTVPHPYLHKRIFALKPLAEIAGDLIHPVSKKTISQLLEECMKTKTLNIKSRVQTEFIDITDDIKKLIAESDIQNGICVIYIPHTTAGITINEGADASVKRDIIVALNKLVPFECDYQHREGNSAAHIKSTLTGISTTVIIEDGKLLLGTWQSVYFCEFDGPRHRRAIVKLISDKE